MQKKWYVAVLWGSQQKPLPAFVTTSAGADWFWNSDTDWKRFRLNLGKTVSTRFKISAIQLLRKLSVLVEERKDTSL